MLLCSVLSVFFVCGLRLSARADEIHAKLDGCIKEITQCNTQGIVTGYKRTFLGLNHNITIVRLRGKTNGWNIKSIICMRACIPRGKPKPQHVSVKIRESL